jgi:drug/metabolite transporter (DMT)-like permease
MIPLPNGLVFAGVSLVWGLTWLAVKAGSAIVPPLLLGSIRFLLAGGLMGLLVLLRHGRWTTTMKLRLIASGLLINAFCHAMLLWGIAHSPTGLAALVNLALIPVLGAMFGRLSGVEQVTRAQTAAIMLGLAGLSVLFVTRLGRPGDSSIPGLAMVVGGTVFYSAGSFVSRPLLGELPPLVVTAWQGLIGGVGLLAIELVVDRPGRAAFAGLMRPEVLFSLSFLVFGGSFIGLVGYMRLVRDWGVFRAGLYAFVSPLIALAVGVGVLGEALHAWDAGAAALMFTATGLALRRASVDRSPMAA